MVHVQVLVLTDWHEGLGRRMRIGGRWRRPLSLAEKTRVAAAALGHVQANRPFLLFLGGDMLHVPEREHEEYTAAGAERTLHRVVDSLAGIVEIAARRHLRPACIYYALGNHGRSTHRVAFGVETPGHYEAVIGSLLRDRLLGMSPVQFFEGRRVVRHAGVKIGLQHGHMLRSSANRSATRCQRLKAQNEADPADVDLFGHFHALHVTNRAVACPALAGYDAVSMALGCDVTEPGVALVRCSRSGVLGVEVFGV